MHNALFYPSVQLRFYFLFLLFSLPFFLPSLSLRTRYKQSSSSVSHSIFLSSFYLILMISRCPVTFLLSPFLCFVQLICSLFVYFTCLLRVSYSWHLYFSSHTLNRTSLLLLVITQTFCLHPFSRWRCYLRSSSLTAFLTLYMTEDATMIRFSFSFTFKYEFGQ